MIASQTLLPLNYVAEECVHTCMYMYMYVHMYIYSMHLGRKVQYQIERKAESKERDE